MTWFTGIILSVLGFLAGRILNQSELVLADKRRCYEEFLRCAPTPNDAYEDWWSDQSKVGLFNHSYATILLYAAPNVVLAISRYLTAHQEATAALDDDSAPLDPLFKLAAKAHNDVILEMRRDALAWSVFSYRGKTRLPPDALEQARKNSL